jgi:mono/diheme cytochrome c family protein
MNIHRLLIGSLSGIFLGAFVQGAQAQDMDGKALFQKNCAACHQANGKGIPGAFPALAGNALLQGAAADAATVLLRGRGGMPDFSASLSDADIARVLSYARASWGNQAGALSDTEVASLRASLQAAQAGTGRLSNKH